MTKTELQTLIAWHMQRGFEAMHRAERASSDECRASNEDTMTMHRITVEALAQLCAS